ncbi:MAG: nitroreductase family protein, partial [Pseudomonadota bacterium]
MTRRSTYGFKPDPVPDEAIDKIIEAARWAPSGANSQPWEFVVVKDKGRREKIVEFFKEQVEISYRVEQTRPLERRFPRYRKRPAGTPGFAEAPVYIVTCGDPRTKEAYPLQSKLDRGDSNFYSSLASAFLYMHLAATAMGLGSQWVTSSAQDLMQGRLKELLDIPYELEVYDLMVIGFSIAESKPRNLRAKEEMVHYEVFDRSRMRTEQQARDFIDRLWKG